MEFAKAMFMETAKTRTENGAKALNTTGSELLNLFGCVGSLRQADEDRITRLFSDAYAEDKLLATKLLFYARDIRGGLGERRTFKVILKWLAENHPEVIEKNIELIPFYGRFDDYYELIDTKVEIVMWTYVKSLLISDMTHKNAGEPCSLLAKWLKTADASSEKTRKLGIYTAKALGYSVYDYKRIVRSLRKYIDVTEVKMTDKRWDEIQYSTVPSKAMSNYRNAFMRHDGERFGKFLEDVGSGKEKINASTLYPYEIVEKMWKAHWWNGLEIKDDPVLEAQWKALPNYVAPGTNAIVIADTSGSMTGRPMYSAVSLAIYFAERNTGAYHNLWMSFSGDSRVQRLKGETLAQKLRSIDMNHWSGNTNLEAAFNHVLDIAVSNNVPKEEMVKSIIVISDMEIDSCTNDGMFYDSMQKEYAKFGYEMPCVIFWNVNSRHDIFHVDAKRPNTILCSGQATSTFKNVVGAIGKTPFDVMMDVLNDPRYDLVTV